MVVVSAECLPGRVRDYLNMQLECPEYYSRLPMNQLERKVKIIQNGLSCVCGNDSPHNLSNHALYELGCDIISEIIFSSVGVNK